MEENKKYKLPFMREDEFIEDDIKDYHQIKTETTIITKYTLHGSKVTWTHHIKCHVCKIPTLCRRSSADPLCRNCFYKSQKPIKDNYCFISSSDED